jgi:integrase
VTLTTAKRNYPGVDQHGSGWRVRLSFNGQPYIETGFATEEDAIARRAELVKLRTAGLTPAAAPAEMTLAAAAEKLLIRKRTTVSRKTKRRLRASGIEWWERATRPWREGPFADLPLSLLRRDSIEDAHLERIAVAPKAGRDELDALKATLRHAAGRGARFDLAILEIERPALTPRTRLALDVAELELLADVAPDYARRLLLFAGTVGLRIGEMFTLTDDRIDLAAAEVFIPAALNKEGEDKWVALTPEEVTLLREQLLARAPGTPLVFPTKTGRPWRHFQFLRLVMHKARDRAAAAWLEQRGLPESASTPFDRLQPHDLRSTAATLMRDAGFAREDAAARLGHADSGELLDRIYDQGDRRARMRKAIAAHAPRGLRTTLAEPGTQPSLTTVAAGSAVAERGLNSAPGSLEG